MGKNTVLTRLPAVRLLLPMVAGIVVARLGGSYWVPAATVLMAIVSWFVIGIKGNTVAGRMRWRHNGIVPLWLVMIAVGWIASWVDRPVSFDYKHLIGSVACARVETIKFNEKSMLMQVKLLNANGSDELVQGARVLLSTRGCEYNLEAGDLVAFKLNLSRVRNMGNPDEMDYAQYLHDRGLIYRQHIKVSDIAKVGYSPTLTTKFFELRQDLEHQVLNSSLSPDSQALIIAMLLGNDEFVEPSVRDSFSHAGIAHVLALSGMHVAVISLIMWFLLFPLDYLRGKKLRLVLTLLSLVAFDLFTGMSPSVVRSTVMIAFVMASQLFYRKSNPLNAVVTAALAILIFSPSSLFNVGFQLSFITVASLIVFYQAFDLKFPSNKLLNYLCTTAATSAVATVSTLVLTAYYFNIISIVSVITNLLVMPLVPVLMVLGVLAVVMLAMGGGVMLLGDAIDWLTATFQWMAGTMSSLSLGSSVYVNWGVVVAYYAMLMMLAMWMSRRNARWLLAAGAMVVAMLAIILVEQVTTPRRGLVIFNSFDSTPVLYYNENEAVLWVPDVENDYDIEKFKRWNRAFLAHHRIDSVRLVDSAGCVLPGAAISPPYANIMGTGIVAAGRGRWKHYARHDSTNVKFNYVLITKGFHSDVATLRNLYSASSVILSGAIYQDDNTMLDHECDSLGISHHNIRLDGAYIKMD